MLLMVAMPSRAQTTAERFARLMKDILIVGLHVDTPEYVAEHEMCRRYPRDLDVACAAADIRRIHSQGRITVLLSVEGGHQIQDDLSILRNYCRLGVRYMTLTHFKANNWANAATGTARHIDHIAKLVGPDHVGVGSDFDGISGMAPQGLEDISKLPVLVRGLLERGYSDSDIRKIAGENLLRVMQQAEQAR
jgi:microsomal dipeptidase-like Zn-dependent dipeptidase